MSGCLGTAKAGLLDIQVNGHKKVSTNGGSVGGCVLQGNNARFLCSRRQMLWNALLIKELNNTLIT